MIRDSESPRCTRNPKSSQAGGFEDFVSAMTAALPRLVKTGILDRIVGVVIIKPFVYK